MNTNIPPEVLIDLLTAVATSLEEEPEEWVHEKGPVKDKGR